MASISPEILSLREQVIAGAKQRELDAGVSYPVEVTSDLDYVGDGDENHFCDLLVPEGRAAELLPVIMEVHGGAFVSCNKYINDAHSKYYASRGYKVVNINYTLQPEVTFVEEMQEMFAAMHWICDNAERFAFDLSRFYLSGDSAGGFHVLLLNAIQYSTELQRYFDVEPISCGIKGVATSCPCGDVRRILSDEGPIWPLVRQIAFANDLASDEDYIHHISMPDMYLMAEGYPRIFVSTTPTDQLLYEDTVALHELMQANGIDHIYKEYVGREHTLDHVFNVAYPEWEESREANEDFLAFFEEQARS